jgi:putative ABC transport system substrate-binding protein
MRRRDFISLAGGTAVIWPLVAHAQQPERMRRVGVLSSLAETDPEAQAWDAAFRKRLVELGWIDGRSISIIAGAPAASTACACSRGNWSS